MTPTRPDSSARLKRDLGLAGAVALCVGNMVGTSIYTLPASLARTAGPLGILAWVLTAFGYLFVALVYASLGRRYPRTGGPYVFVREAFGELPAFQTMWSYWVSAVIGNAAIATSVVGYATGLSETLRLSTPLQFALGQGLLWGLCALNVAGVRATAGLQLAVVAMNVVPLIAIDLISLPSIDGAALTPFAPHGWSAIVPAMALVVWGFAGVESATVPADEVKGEGTAIERGTMIGYAIATLVFLLTSLVANGVVEASALEASSRPMALVAERTVGPIGATLVAGLAILAGTGTLNGWILLAGRVPVSAAQDGLFFASLAKVHPRTGTPHVALIAGTAVSSAMLLLYFHRSLLEVFDTIALLAVLTTLLPHLYVAAAEWLLARRDGHLYDSRARRRAMITAPLAFGFVLYTIYGAGAEVVLLGTIALLTGLPLYVYFATQQRKEALA